MRYFLVCYTAYDNDSTKVSEWEFGEYPETPSEGMLINIYNRQHSSYQDTRVVYVKELDENEFKDIHSPK